MDRMEKATCADIMMGPVVAETTGREQEQQLLAQQQSQQYATTETQAQAPAVGGVKLRAACDECSALFRAQSAATYF
jgi:hypothetical protein